MALDAITGAVIPGFAPVANNRVQALAVNGNTLYVGGFFTAFGGQPGSRLGAVNTTNGALLDWAPQADRDVVSMTVHPSSGRVIAGGSFEIMNGVTQYGMTSLDGGGEDGRSTPVQRCHAVLRHTIHGGERATGDDAPTGRVDGHRHDLTVGLRCPIQQCAAGGVHFAVSRVGLATEGSEEPADVERVAVDRQADAVVGDRADPGVRPGMASSATTLRFWFGWPGPLVSW